MGGSPIGIAVGHGAVWTTHETDAGVWRHDPATGRVQQRIGVGNAPGPIVVGEGAVWVANTFDGTVSRIDPATNAVVATVKVGEGPAALAVAEDGVWVADELGGALVRIDPRSDVVAERVETGQRPSGLAADGGRLWVAARDASAEHRGGTLRVAVPGFEGIDQDYSVVSWMNLTGDGLTAYRRAAAPAGATVVPDLATSLPTPTDDGRTYTFTMREGIRYSTGEPVRPGDIRRGIERFFRLGPPDSPDYYDRIVGADACRRRPATCDLSRGIVADDAANTVTIHLTEPDPDLLHRLALPFAHAVAPSAPKGAPTTEGLPATGPYVIASHVPGEEVRFVRNPAFREWSRAARPDGYPDEILVTVAGEAEALKAVEEGRIDVDLFGRLGGEDVARLTAQYPDRVSVAPLAVTLFVTLNTERPPFDREDARRAVAFALDREALAGGGDGSRHAQIACQILPPSFPAYEPYCPFTTDPGDGRWHGPDLETARALVARSGTTGAEVTVRTLPELAAEARQVAFTLDAIGYRADAEVMDDDEWLAAAYGPGGERRPGRRVGVGHRLPGAVVVPGAAPLRGGRPGGLLRPGDRRAHPGRAGAPVARPGRRRRRLGGARPDPDRPRRMGPLRQPARRRLVSERVGNLVPHPVWRLALDQTWVR